VVAEQLAAHVRELLRQLPEAQRDVLILRDVEGFEPSEAAAILGVTDGNLRVLLHRGRARLRQLLAQEMRA
jgi:RNA polymerase sigma-70 factor (ECF subfamily)